MATNFAVSSGLIEPLYDNAQKYDFSLQAYGNFDLACKKLVYVNSSDLIGIAVVDEVIEDEKGFDKFLGYCDCIQGAVVLVACNRKYVVPSVINSHKTRILCVNDIEVFTDLVINRDVYGALLLEKFEPYKIRRKEEVQGTWGVATLSYTPLFSKYVLKITELPNIESIELGADADKIYNELVDVDPILANLRKIYLQHWENKIDSSFEESTLEKILTIEDEKTFCSFMSLFQSIVAGEEAVR